MTALLEYLGLCTKFELVYLPHTVQFIAIRLLLSSICPLIIICNPKQCE